LQSDSGNIKKILLDFIRAPFIAIPAGCNSLPTVVEACAIYKHGPYPSKPARRQSGWGRSIR
jgi:hypothetical protein